MAYTEERRFSIFNKTDGNCHICHGRLVLSCYGAKNAERGGWEVEHSVPKSMGGTEHLNNLYPAHISCNRSKGMGSTRNARAQHGLTRAPHSKTKKASIRTENMMYGGMAGAVLGGLVAGPPGAAIGAVLLGAAGRGTRVPR
jgi:5-methylcytosine-specific restriction endonuclease McrA